MSEKKKYIGIRIYPKIDELINKVAESLGFTKSEYIRELIMGDLRKYGLISIEIKKKLELIPKLTKREKNKK